MRAIVVIEPEHGWNRAPITWIPVYYEVNIALNRLVPEVEMVTSFLQGMSVL